MAPPSLPTGGDVLILNGLPANFTIGCDSVSFSAQKPFPGFREIPPGAHLIWVSPSELTSSRSGYWIFTPERKDGEELQVYVKQWDKANEILTVPSEAEQQLQKQRLGQIYNSLVPYRFFISSSGASPIPSNPAPAGRPPPPLDNATLWSQLTSAIDAGLLARVAGATAGRDLPVSTMDRVEGRAASAEEAALYAGSGASELRFSFPSGSPLVSAAATGEARTRQALDATGFVLETLARRDDDDDDDGAGLEGELALAFLTGAHLGNHACLDQWWFAATRVALRSYGLAAARPALAARLLRALRAQLAYCERRLAGGLDALLDAMPAGAPTALRRALAAYGARLAEEEGAAAEPRAAFAELAAWARGARGWDLRDGGAGARRALRFGGATLDDGEVLQGADPRDVDDGEDDRGEFAPAVVELDERGREVGLVSWADDGSDGGRQ
ncbi:A1 cistron-splicing factor [Durotheca rogersii]|uniref:A1 cistron-splicing factor n=1 Tax=Durotheca rogersii TaxID=419775 RepID=UPI002220E474|nr:A1 cistron-splicing factor [Durotheca rogersii]KAI5864597.1 A1 cistron-splicing factor [Durotheca rogersii]